MSQIERLEAIRSTHLDIIRKIDLVSVVEITERIWTAITTDHKVMICGCGGSASDSQHFAAELCGRFFRNRPGMAALALTTDTSLITSIGNDFGFEHVFSRQVQSLGRRGDVLIAISTSGGSLAVRNAVRVATAAGIGTIAFTGLRGREFQSMCDHSLMISSESTARIQEGHGLAIHMIAHLIDERAYAKGNGMRPTDLSEHAFDD